MEPEASSTLIGKEGRGGPPQTLVLGLRAGWKCGRTVESHFDSTSMRLYMVNSWDRSNVDKWIHGINLGLFQETVSKAWVEPDELDAI